MAGRKLNLVGGFFCSGLTRCGVFRLIDLLKFLQQRGTNMIIQWSWGHNSGGLLRLCRKSA
jgi:hypothetical protein